MLGVKLEPDCRFKVLLFWLLKWKAIKRGLRGMSVN